MSSPMLKYPAITLEQCDQRLGIISNILKHGYPDRELCMKKIDRLLDTRLRITKGGE